MPDFPDIQITDQLGDPVQSIKPDLTKPSSWVPYLKTKVMHLAVAPDFLQLKDSVLTKAAPKPIEFKAKVAEKCQLGSSQPEISLAPSSQVEIRVNATPGSKLDDADAPGFTCAVPPATGYVSIAFEGSLDLGVSGSDGDLTFGFDTGKTASLAHFKAFQVGSADEPKLGDAFARTISSFVIPADLTEVQKLGINDVAVVSGGGSLKVSGGAKVTVIPNPLASVNLPLNVGTACLSGGPAVALSTSFELTGTYEIRARRMNADSIEITFSPQRGTTFKADLSGSAGLAAKLSSFDVSAAILGAVSTDPAKDKDAFAELKDPERDALQTAIKSGLSQNLQACVEQVLSVSTEEKPAFQYQVQPSKLSADATAAVNRALKGDLSLLTGMEANMHDGVLAPGLTMLQSIMADTFKRDLTLKLNLIGLLNYTSVGELVRHSEVLTDEVSGDVTIKEVVTGNRISAIVDETKRAEALRKVMFDSVMATTSYKAGKAVVMPDVTCEQVHFDMAANTNKQTIEHYLKWLVTLNLLPQAQVESSAEGFAARGRSTCVLRIGFDDKASDAMFFDTAGNLYPEAHYLDIGRHAMLDLLDPPNIANDALRVQVLSNELWPQALEKGPTEQLAELVNISPEDARVELLIGDVYSITTWAHAMADAGKVILQTRRLVGDADPKTLIKNAAFNAQREALQKKLATMVNASRVRFDEPWGMLCLYRAAGSPPMAYGKLATAGYALERGAKPALAAAVQSGNGAQ